QNRLASQKSDIQPHRPLDDLDNNEIEPNEEDYESDVNDFIEDDLPAVPQERRVKDKRNSKGIFGLRRDGPTYDQVQEARDIFGDGYDDLGDDTFNEALYDENEVIAPADTRAYHDNKISNFEYIQLVQSFCLDEDESIRNLDIPERIQLYVGKQME